MPLAWGEDESVSEAIGEYFAEMIGHPVFMIRWGDMKYIHCDDDLAKLYDLANDPWELENLADHPAYRVIS
jgi:choline-sulfatase